MPTYSRHCDKCDELFDVVCKIAEKETAIHECPYCGCVDGTYRPTSCHTSMESGRFSATNKPSGFKEVLQKIAERNPRTSVTQQV
jgi:hypothetical protein